jgi:hypothetical protein
MDTSSLIPVGTLLLGWGLSEVSASFRSRREDRRAVGPVLKDLLEIRHRLIGLDAALAELKKYLPIPPEASLPIKQALSTLVPEAPRFAERYEEAVSIVARADPLLSFRLGGQSRVGPLIGWLRGLIAPDQAASKFWGGVGEPQLVNLFRPHLEELILDVARTHGPLTRWRTRRYLRKSPHLAPDEQQMLSAFLSDLQKQMAAVPPAANQSSAQSP